MYGPRDIYEHKSQVFRPVFFSPIQATTLGDTTNSPHSTDGKPSSDELLIHRYPHRTGISTQLSLFPIVILIF